MASGFVYSCSSFSLARPDVTVVPWGAWRGLGMPSEVCRYLGRPEGSWSYLEGPIGDWWGAVRSSEVVVLGGAW